MDDAKATPAAGIKAAELFVRCLEAEGVELIFGLPGEENADLMIALLDSKIRFILVRHEQAAAFMADVYGRLTGRAGVCLATLGPGATNLVTGLADANMDRSPVVAIIGQGSTRRLHKESHQNMDAIAMMRPISKWAQSIIDADAIPEILRKAFKLAEAEKPGVCVVELPEDVAKYKGKYDAGYESMRQARLLRLQQMGLIAKNAELSPTFGDWTQVKDKEWETRCMETYAAMIVNPDPQYLEPMSTSAEHAADAAERYRTDTVKQPEEISSTQGLSE